MTTLLLAILLVLAALIVLTFGHLAEPSGTARSDRAMDQASRPEATSAAQLKGIGVNQITINGQTYQAGRNASISVVNGRVTINGEEPIELEEKHLKIVVEGTLASLATDMPVDCGDVMGDVNTRGPVECGDVGGSVHTQGPVSCGDVGGDVYTRGPVSRG